MSSLTTRLGGGLAFRLNSCTEISQEFRAAREITACTSGTIECHFNNRLTVQQRRSAEARRRTRPRNTRRHGRIRHNVRCRKPVAVLRPDGAGVSGAIRSVASATWRAGGFAPVHSCIATRHGSLASPRPSAGLVRAHSRALNNLEFDRGSVANKGTVQSELVKTTLLNRTSSMIDHLD